MPKKPMQNHVVRIPEPLWVEARRVADARDETISEVIRAALERYVKRHRRD